LLGVIIITAVAVDRLRQQRLSPSGQVSS
jgi:hypothetical protein